MHFLSDHRTPRAANLVAAFFGLAVALTLVEALTRLFVPDPAYRFENQIGMFEPSSVLGYRNKPNFRGYANGYVPIEVNALGFRDGPASFEKPANSVRVLALGDSITWGVRVGKDETYVRLLESLLNEQLAPSGRRAETINAGVVGYSFQQELLALQHDGVALSPDIVLIGFAPNDFYPTEDP